MTTETIDIQVDDSQLNQLIDALQSLVKSLNKTEKEAKDTAKSLDKLEDEAKTTTESLDKLEKEAKKSERALDKLKKAAKELGSGLSTAADYATGLSSVLEIGKQAFELFKVAAEAAYAAVEVAAENNAEAARSLEEFNDAVTKVKTAIGLAVIQTRAWRDVQAILNSLISESDGLTASFKASVDALWDSLKDVVTSLLELTSTVLPAFNTNMTLATGEVVNMKDVLEGGFDNNPMKQSLLQVATIAFQLAQGIDDASTSLQTLWQTAKAVQLGLSTIGQFISTGSVSQETLQQIYDLEDEVDRIITDAVSREDTRRNTLALLTAQLTGDGGGGPRTRSGVGDDGVPDALRRPAEEGIPDALRRRPRSSSGSATRELITQQQIGTKIKETRMASVQLAREAAWAAQALTKEETFILNQAKEQLIVQRQKAEQDRQRLKVARELAELARQESIANKQSGVKAAIEEARNQRETFQTGAIDAGFSFGQEALRGLIEGSDTLGLDIGQSFSETGFGFLSTQLPALLGATGPIGALIGGGISLIGSAISGIFERERKRREREARAAAPQNFNTSSNYITTNNVGLVIGDRRAVTQQLSNFNNDTQRRTG